MGRGDGGNEYPLPLILWEAFMIAVFITLLMNTAFAKEDWLCTQESSQVQGGQIYSCGVGIGKDEDEARTKAFNSAKNEYAQICEISTTCKDKSVSVEPRRTSCEKEGDTYKCYRLIVFTIGTEPAKVVRAKQTEKYKDYTMDDYFKRMRNTYLRPHDQ